MMGDMLDHDEFQVEYVRNSLRWCSFKRCCSGLEECLCYLVPFFWYHYHMK